MSETASSIFDVDASPMIMTKEQAAAMANHWRVRALGAEARLAQAREALRFCKRAVADPRLGWPEETRGAVDAIADRALADTDPTN